MLAFLDLLKVKAQQACSQMRAKECEKGGAASSVVVRRLGMF